MLLLLYIDVVLIVVSPEKKIQPLQLVVVLLPDPDLVMAVPLMRQQKR